MTPLEVARSVADAVLYEGYVLYPYRASSSKNQVRFQWGVLMPEDVVAVDGSERSWHRTEVVVDGHPGSLRVLVRFLQVQRREVTGPDGAPVARLELGDTTYLPWDEAVEREVELDLGPLLEEGGDLDRTFEIPGGEETELLTDGSGAVAGRLVRTREPLRVGVVARVDRPHAPYAVALVSLRVENHTPPGSADEPDRRPSWLRRALVACHELLEVDAGAFVSLLDPPQWASGYAAGCRNDGVFPVLAGPPGHRRVVLSSPIILYDHPMVAPESRTAFFDSLEIDELLSLRTLTLSEEERREVRGTDARAAALLDEVDGLPADLWERLHGAVRSLDAATPPVDPDHDPDHDAVVVGGVEVRRGSRVVLRPGVRRADAHDLFLAGRTATVAAVLFDVDNGEHLAVTVDDDPGADLKLAHGRFLYFAPDEVEPLAGGEVP